MKSRLELSRLLREMLPRGECDEGVKLENKGHLAFSEAAIVDKGIPSMAQIGRAHV